MEDAVSVHVLYGLEQLVHVMLDSLLWQVVRAAYTRSHTGSLLTFNGFIKVHLHELKDKSESPSGFVTTLSCFKRNVTRGLQSAE